MIWTLNNAKARKGLARGWLTPVLHFAPAMLSGTEMCARRSPGCTFGCLNLAGCGPTRSVQAGRLARTHRFLADPEAFLTAAVRELDRWHRYAERNGLNLAARPNGTSDRYDVARALCEACPDVHFYDYTKLERPWERVRPNYDLTFSRSETNEAACIAALAHGVNVAVVFGVRKGHPLPGRFFGRSVIDGDLHDLRFLDPRGVIVGLRAKGKRAQRYATQGFVVGSRTEGNDDAA